MKEPLLSLTRCTVEGNVLSLPSVSEMPIPNYPTFKKMLMNAGGKYVKNTFVFPQDAQIYVDRLMGGETVNLKKETQFYATPSSLAKILVATAGIKPGDTILEPSAGHGAIIDEILKVRDESNVVFFCEKDIDNSLLLGKKYNDTPECYFLRPQEDFLTLHNPNQFNKIIANPPFSKNQDIDHIRKMYEVLATGGRIVSVASNHWRTSSNKKEKEFVQWLGFLGVGIKDIPAGTFKESGTNISACILIIDKK